MLHQPRPFLNHAGGGVGGGLVNHAGFPPPTPAQFLAPNSNMRLRAGEQQVFVSVAYDFEYLAEDGKRVFMKENEILLLINKTNHDWWQVIRRGDRRPFYAPAKYVVELRPEDVPSSPEMHGGLHHHNLNFSTFGPLKGKRSSYAPASGSSGMMLIPPPAASLEATGRLRERNRSNSLDSILVADLDAKQMQSTEHVQEMVAVHHHSQRPGTHASSATYHVFTQQHHFIPKSQLNRVEGQGQQQRQPRGLSIEAGTGSVSSSNSGMSLQKRPTFEALDKRKSWTLEAAAAAGAAPPPSQAPHNSGGGGGAVNLTASENNGGRPGSQQTVGHSPNSRISAYQNTHILKDSTSAAAAAVFINNVNSTSSYDPRRKKPVPLPRSKIPVLLPAGIVEAGHGRPQRTSGGGGRFMGLGPRSKTDLTSSGLSSYKKQRPNNIVANKFPATPVVPGSSNTNSLRPVPQKRETPVKNSEINLLSKFVKDHHQSLTNKKDQNKLSSNKQPRPEIKEKPTFSTFKQLHQHHNIVRTASLSDLLDDVEEDEEIVQPSVIIHNKKKSRKKQNHPTGNGNNNSFEKNRENKAFADHLETTSLASVNFNVPDPILPSALSTKSITVQTDEVDLSLEIQNQNSNINNSNAKSDPLTISTEPLNGEIVATLADASLSTSFDSMEDSKSKSGTDVSMEDALIQNVSKDADEDEEDLPTPPETPPLEERLKSPVSTTSRSPPSPNESMTPTRKVTTDWEEYTDDLSGRKFYFNTSTKERSWKPPRKPRESSGSYAPTSPKPENKESPIDVVAEPKSPEIPTQEVPNGYEKRTDADSGNSYYVNVFTGVRWFSAEDSTGKVYFYEENGNESCWALPNVSQSIQDPGGSESTTSTPEPGAKERENSNESTSKQKDVPTGGLSVKTKTELLEQRRLNLPVSTPDFKIGNVNISVIKQGPLHKTKLLENGKKQRKNWNVAHIVLTDTFLLFFKDAKSFANLQSGNNSKPDFCIDLKGAIVDWCSSDKSKRSNVFEVSSAILGTTVLLQDDSLAVAAEWFQEIQKIIETLNTSPKSRRSSTDTTISTTQSNTLQLPASKKANKVGRTKSLKMKILGSNEELLDENPSPTSPTSVSGLSTPGSAGVGGGGATAITFQSGQRNNIREKLRKFFLRRPAMDDLFRKGIIKNEPVFGSTLRELQAADLSDIPNFVRKCVESIEKGDLLKTDGVYRQSGNLSTIQKIRLQVDQGNLAIIDSVEDVHVLTGSLKLFFRELKEPLIPWDIVGKLLLAANHQSKKQKIKQIKDCVAAMPTSHRATLAFLLKHLLKVTTFKEKNRMQIPNLAIVFGPTLMWPPAHLVSVNLALDMMQQNIIVEALLNNVHNIFPA